MILYCATGGEDASTYFATKDAAMRDARNRSKEDPEVSDGVVERCVLAKITKAVIIDLANGAGRFVAESTEIATFKNGKRVK